MSSGIAVIRTSYNNTIVTITDNGGNTITWSSAGACGYKGSRKSTGFAAQEAGKKAGVQAKNKGVSELRVIVKGPGSGRESSIEGLHSAGLSILSICDRTNPAFAGCRKKKRRKV